VQGEAALFGLQPGSFFKNRINFKVALRQNEL
jgi:hypothetical protein